AHFKPITLVDTRNITFVGHPAGGLVCLKVTAGQPMQNVVATLETNASGNVTDQIRATFDSAVIQANCDPYFPPGPSLRGETTTPAGGGVNVPFYVLVN